MKKFSKKLMITGATLLAFLVASVAGSKRTLRFASLVAALSLIGGLLAILPASAGPLLKGTFRGNAFGTFANAKANDVSASLGRSGYVVCPCKGTNGKVRRNKVTDVRATEDGKVLLAEVVNNSVFTDKTATTATVKNTSDVTGLSLFDADGAGGPGDPLITADGIKAVANTNATERSIRSSAQGSSLLNLTIDGTPIDSGLKPDTMIGLPGVGTVMVKKLKQHGDGLELGGITVQMLVIDVDDPTALATFGLDLGTKIIVGSAKSGFSRRQPEALVDGTAYATRAESTSPLVENGIGRAAAIYLGCEGTDNKTNRNNIFGLDVFDSPEPNVVSTGTGETTARGGRTEKGTVALTTAVVEDLDLLDADPTDALPGLITADSVRAVAKSTYGKNNKSGSTTGSRFVNLKVLGAPVESDVAPNTTMDLPGIGYVLLYERKISAGRSGVRVSVSMIRIFVNQVNVLGLPVGTEITLSHATSGAEAY